MTSTSGLLNDSTESELFEKEYYKSYWVAKSYFLNNEYFSICIDRKQLERAKKVCETNFRLYGETSKNPTRNLIL